MKKSQKSQLENQSKNQKKIIDCPCYYTKYLNLESGITSKMLREVADDLDQNKINKIYFDFDAGYNNVDINCFETRLETDKELNKRIKIQKEEEDKRLKFEEKQKLALIEQAKKLGLILVDHKNDK